VESFLLFSACASSLCWEKGFLPIQVIREPMFRSTYIMSFREPMFRQGSIILLLPPLRGGEKKSKIRNQGREFKTYKEKEG
jgi:hypothetical protein